MKKKLLSTLSLAFAVVVAAASISIDAAAQTKDEGKKQSNPIVLKSAKGDAGSKGGDPNIKKAEAPNDPSVKTAAPPSKGGAKGAQGVCKVNLDNSTEWAIKIYVDGGFMGTIGPWGDSFVYVYSGQSVYARADFRDGSYLYWGPRSYNCYGNNVFFRMTD